jgi:hypothetical protein
VYYRYISAITLKMEPKTEMEPEMETETETEPKGGQKIRMVEDAEDIVSMQQATQSMFEIKLKHMGHTPKDIHFDMDSDTTGSIYILKDEEKKTLLTANIDVVGFVDYTEEMSVIIWQWIWTVIDMPITQEYKDVIMKDENIIPFCQNVQNIFVDPMHFRYMISLVNYSMEYELLIPYIDGKTLGLKNIKYVT